MSTEPKEETYGRKEKKKYKNKEKNKDKENPTENGESDSDEIETEGPSEQQIAASINNRLKVSRRYLLPRIFKQIVAHDISACRYIWEKYIEKNALAKEVNGGGDKKGDEDKNGDDSDCRMDFVKIFGSINDVNEVMDKECKYLPTCLHY